MSYGTSSMFPNNPGTSLVPTRLVTCTTTVGCPCKYPSAMPTCPLCLDTVITECLGACPCEACVRVRDHVRRRALRPVAGTVPA